jgi:AcrR family transcriptional regulator
MGRQSMYAAFGDKPRLYLAALEQYQRESVGGHIPEMEDLRKRGCMDVGSASEFGATDPEPVKMGARSSAMLFDALTKRLEEAQVAGGTDPGLDLRRTAEFLQMTMVGLQLSARSASAEALRRITVNKMQSGPTSTGMTADYSPSRR